MKVKVALLFMCLASTIFALEFTIIVPSYNNEQFFFRNLESLIHQKTYLPFNIIYINDCSTDRTGMFVDAYVAHFNLHSLITVIHNKQNQGCLANLYQVIHQLPDDRVIVVVDGDDWLAHDRVLDRVAREYLEHDAWLTYGQYIYYPGGEIGICKKFPHDIILGNAFRQYDWISSHLKTFYAGLFKKIRLQDLQWEGKFFSMANDVAMMMPMLEMASNGHISYISDVLYVYNHCNPLSNHNLNRAKQAQLCNITFFERVPYMPLMKLFSYY